MAEVNPAYVIGQSSNKAQMFRQVVGNIYGNSGGVLTASDLAVSGTSGASSVTVAAGSAVVVGSHAGYSYQGTYLVTNDASATVSLTTVPSTGAASALPAAGQFRTDLIIARVLDKDYGDGTERWWIDRVTGSTATPTTAPTPTGTWLALAEVYIGSTGFVSMVDKRVVAAPASGPSITTTALLANQTATAGTEGQMVYDKTADQLLINHGGTSPAWRAPWNLPWGVLGYTTDTTTRTGFGTTPTNITASLNIAVTVPANRRLRISGHANVLADSGTPGFVLGAYNTSGSVLIGRLAAMPSSSTTAYTIASGSTIVSSTTAGTTTYGLYLYSLTATVGLGANLGLVTWFMVEDIGPASTVP